MTRAELAALVGAARTPAPVESPLTDLGSIESFKAVDFYFDHSYEVYPPSAKPGEYQIGGPTAVFADASDAAAYVALRNHAEKLLAVCEAAERLHNECCDLPHGKRLNVGPMLEPSEAAVLVLRAKLRDLEGA